jgi:hypothetical protein
MTALAKQDAREVARPLKTLEKLINEVLESADEAGMPYYKAAGELLNEARDGHFDGDAGGFWKWAEEKFGRNRNTLRTWMALGAHKGAKRFKTLTEVEEKVLKYHRPPVSRREYSSAVDDIAERARNEARRLAAEDALTRQQERDAEAKLGMRLIDIGYRVLAKELHPDKGGSREAMTRLGRVRDRLRSNV